MKWFYQSLPKCAQIYFFSVSLISLHFLLYSQIDSNCTPMCNLIIHRSSYSLSFDLRTKNARWVYEKIFSNSNKLVTRKGCSFKSDHLIPSIFRSTIKDYNFSGFDRGHLAAAGNHLDSQEAIEETFYLSNICPQKPSFNRGYWSKFEKYIRDLTQECGILEIFTGPLFMPIEDANGKKWVKYEVIGENNVAVPTHFYKVLVFKNLQGKKEIQAYILPNEQIANNTSLNHFKTTLDNVQKIAGVLFFPIQDSGE